MNDQCQLVKSGIKYFAKVTPFDTEPNIIHSIMYAKSLGILKQNISSNGKTGVRLTTIKC